MEKSSMSTTKSYQELITIPDFKRRFLYLKEKTGTIGDLTFGGRRQLNQTLYRSPEWKRIRREIIIRDNGCDLAHPDYPIGGRVIIHHIEEITAEDILQRSYKIFDPDNLICVSHNTHEAIHFGDEHLLPKEFVERKPGDTCLW